MHGKLSDFIGEAGQQALEAMVAAAASREASRISVERPKPSATLAAPLVIFPNGASHGPHLERLRMEYEGQIRPVGEPCPSCERPLRYSTVVWPSGARPFGMPESAWHCGHCRQYYTYVCEHRTAERNYVQAGKAKKKA